MEHSVPIRSNTFWWTPFLEKGPPRITEGGPFDPHRPISRINPAIYLWSLKPLHDSRFCTVTKTKGLLVPNRKLRFNGLLYYDKTPS